MKKTKKVKNVVSSQCHWAGKSACLRTETEKAEDIEKTLYICKNRIGERDVNICLPPEDGFTRNSVSSVSSILKVRGFQTGRLPIRLTGYKKVIQHPNPTDKKFCLQTEK